MDGCGKGEGFVDEEVLLVLGSCWFEEFVFAFVEVTSMRLVPFVRARKTLWAPDVRYRIHCLICTAGVNAREGRA